MIERSHSHADIGVEDLKESAYSIEAERLANVLRDLSEIKDAVEVSRATESVSFIEDYQKRYAQAEASICEVTYLDTEQLYVVVLKFDRISQIL